MNTTERIQILAQNVERKSNLMIESTAYSEDGLPCIYFCDKFGIRRGYICPFNPYAILCYNVHDNTYMRISDDDVAVWTIIKHLYNEKDDEHEKVESLNENASKVIDLGMKYVILAKVIVPLVISVLAILCMTFYSCSMTAQAKAAQHAADQSYHETLARVWGI